MAQSNKEGLILGLTLLVTAGLAGGGYFFFTSSNSSSNSAPTSDPTATAPTPDSPSNPSNPNPNNPANPTVLTIDGSVTMAGIIGQLRNAYKLQNPNLPVTYGIPDNRPGGTNKGLKNLLEGQVLIAASSRTLRPEEAQAGIQLVPIAKDALAIAVGIDNPFQGGLTEAQLRGIFTGKITNWSQVGGPDLPIKVINRAKASGTRDVFQEIILKYEQFPPDSANFITLERDETTPMLRMLGRNGIGYSTIAQIRGQRTVRLLTIDGISPEDVSKVKAGEYPVSRNLFLAIPSQPSPAVKEFIDFALSPQGQRAIERAGYIPIK
jgi:phosphate transport system substrate-binding protein